MTTYTRSPISAVLTDENGYKIDSANPLPVNPAESGAANFSPAQVTVSSASATQLVTTRATRRGVLITNNDASIAMYVGGASVTTANGHYLKAGASISIPTTAALYAKAASGSPVASVSEIYD